MKNQEVFQSYLQVKNINIENYRNQLYFSTVSYVLPWKASLSCLSLTICIRSAILEKVRLEEEERKSQCILDVLTLIYVTLPALRALDELSY